MKYLSLVFTIFLLTAIDLFAQIYPYNFIHNGCDYTYFENGLINVISSENGNEFNLIFEDNFDSTKLNKNKWQTYFPWGRALKNSNSGTGFTREYMKDENVKIKEGFLYLQTKIDSGFSDVYNIPGYDPSWMPPHNNIYFKYSSGMIFSKVNFTAGKFELRAKIPFIDGTWPAFWLYGDCAQEIDVFEFINSSINSDANIDSKNMIMTYHKENNCANATLGKCESPFTYKNPKNLSDDFHIYSVEWDESKILWKLDEKIVREVYRYWEISKPLPLGPAIGFANPIKSSDSKKILNANTSFNLFPEEGNKMSVILSTGVAFDRGLYPKEMVIDYVKIYEPIKNTLIDSVKIENINIFPNPTNGKFTIDATNSTKILNEVIIYNSYVEQIYSSKNLNIEKLEIDFTDKPKSFYIIKVISNNQSFTKKLLLK